MKHAMLEGSLWIKSTWERAWYMWYPSVHDELLLTLSCYPSINVFHAPMHMQPKNYLSSFLLPQKISRLWSIFWDKLKYFGLCQVTARYSNMIIACPDSMKAASKINHGRFEHIFNFLIWVSKQAFVCCEWRYIHIEGLGLDCKNVKKWPLILKAFEGCM